MNLEKQVTNLKLSKKLKKLGVKQESLFWWCDGDLVARTVLNFLIETSDRLFGCGATSGEPEIYGAEDDEYELISAFTVAELGEKLAKAFNQLPGTMIMNPKGKFKKLWTAITGFDNEAENRAKVLIYLIENNLLKKEGG